MTLKNIFDQENIGQNLTDLFEGLSRSFTKPHTKFDVGTLFEFVMQASVNIIELF